MGSYCKSLYYISPCKGTKKNAYTQESERYLQKKIDFSICIRYTTLHSSLLESEVVGYWMQEVLADFLQILRAYWSIVCILQL